MKTYYLSFADPTKPKGSQWLGGLYILAPNLLSAIRDSHEAGINPGGEVVSIEMPADRIKSIKPTYRARLLNEQELRESGVDGDSDLVDIDGNDLPRKD